MKEEKTNFFGKLRSRAIIILPLGCIVITLLLMSFSAAKHSQLRCKSVAIVVEDGLLNGFIDEGYVQSLLTQDYGRAIKGEKVSNISLENIEDCLQKDPYIGSVQTYINLEGDLSINIRQRTPLARVLGQAGVDYYLDSEGKHLPACPRYTAYVPLITLEGIRLNSNKDSAKLLDSTLFELAKALNRDSFMTALTGQVIVDKNLEITIIPRLGNFQLIIGDVSDLGDKFTTLKAFYTGTLPQEGWARYTSISVKYKNQVIAKH
jgi:cell division protein FtsQ